MKIFNFTLMITLLFLSLLTISIAHADMPQKNPQRYLSYSVTGSGMPLLLIHAFPTDQQLWQPQKQGLKNHFKIITLDLWGFGSTSNVSTQAITMEAYADEVKTLLDLLHLKKAIIGGESMGGYIALAFLEKYPERVEGLILSDTQAIADSDEMKAKREASAQDILENGTSNYIQGFLPKALSADASENAKHQLKVMVERQPANAMAAALRGMALRFDHSATLANTKLPVLIITGEDDALISPQQSQLMHQLAKNSRLVLIKQAGHLSNLEQSQQWNQAVIGFFRSIA